MKAKLIFDLGMPEEAYAHLRAIHSTEAYGVIYDVQQALRKWYKYDNPAEATLEEIQKIIDNFDMSCYE